MQIITVAPIARGGLKEHLTYFTKNPVEVGALVVVPIRSREVPALVLDIREVSDMRSAIKLSDYAVRKITRARPRRVWNNAFLKATEDTASFFAQSLGETLLTLTPKAIVDAHIANKIDDTEASIKIKPSKTQLLAIQMSYNDRVQAYRGLIRESFVRHESVFLCLPTEIDVLRISEELRRGIEDYTFILHGTLSKKRVLESWKSALESKHGVLVISTPQYLSLPRYFKTIILDEEHSRSWKTIMRPQIDMRVFAENYAWNAGSTLIFGAPILRPETQKRIHEGMIKEFVHVSSHSYKDLCTKIIDPRIEEKTIKEQTGKRTIQILSEKIRILIKSAQEKKENIVLISARKGLSPITVCGDCGTLVRCPECETPLVIHKKEPSGQGEPNMRIFSCHACGFMRIPEDGAHESCVNCGGWRLEALGIGIGRIEEEVIALFPHTPRLVFDGDHVKTRTQARKLIERFEKTRGSILIATPMVIPYLSSTEHAAIISIDSLFAIPDFRMNERIFALVLALRERTSQTLFIQTRADDTTLLKQAIAGDLYAFTENELVLRKTFHYPPYGTIIKITLLGKKNYMREEMERLKNFLVQYSPITPLAMSRDTRGLFRMHCIIKLPNNTWPNIALIDKLRVLPSQFTVEVNPDNLL